MAQLTRAPKRQGPPSDCPVEECLRFLAGAWTPKIIWFLQPGPRRFGDLRRDLVTVSSKVLTERLREMERQGVVNRKVIPSSPPTVEYSLTALGREFGPVFEAMNIVATKLKKIQKPQTQETPLAEPDSFSIFT